MYNLFYNEGQKNAFAAEFERICRNFKGDPKAEVENLLKTGQMSQEQFNQLQHMATQIQRMLSRK